MIAQTRLVYERDAAVFLARWGTKRYKRPALLAEWLAFMPQRATLLDLGCGAAQDARYLATRGHRVIGLDRSWPLLRFGQSRRPAVPLLCADLRSLPLRAACSDGIWAAASLIHVPKSETASVFAELRRRLKPGGVFAATLTYGTKSRIRNTGWMPGRYFARWTKAELMQVLRHAGWNVLSLRVVVNKERKGRWINVIARRDVVADAP